MVDSTGRASANSIGYNIAAIHNLTLQAFTAEELHLSWIKNAVRSGSSWAARTISSDYSG